MLCLSFSESRLIRPLLLATAFIGSLQFSNCLVAKAEATSHSGVVADYPVKPVPFNEVEMTSDFWRPRLVTQREVLVPFAFERTEPGVKHLKAAGDFLAGKKVEGHQPHRFIDSDLYKVMEGAAYLLQLQPDRELEEKLDFLADVIESAQHNNGYLYPSHTTGVGSSQHMMGDKPYSFVVHSHELYNVGHMYEAAIAYYQATGKDRLLKVAEKSAQHINQVFFAGDPTYNHGRPIEQAPGHQEIELALVKLYRVTGKKLYLDMARKFLEIRGVTYVPDGEGVMSPTYAQQHAPVTKQYEAVGHAVRATYLYSAMADVGTLTGQADYKQALEHIWGNIVDTRMHITGGLGAVHGIEGFGPQYMLPNKDAFNETCAAVGNVLFNYRMFLLTKDAKYLDVAEVALLNNVLAAVNFEGNRFFYVNPLEADGKYPFNHGTPGRAPWFGTACCPSNMARLIPQVPGMAYAHNGDDLYVTIYSANHTSLGLDNGNVTIEQRTSYPNDGVINLTISPENPTQFRLLLRIPTWTGNQFLPGELYHFVDHSTEPFKLFVNSKPVEAVIERGFAVIDRRWNEGDQVQLQLPMPVRASECHAAVEANRGRVALTRGPFVLCAEETDNGGATQRFFLELPPANSMVDISETTFSKTPFLKATIPAEAVTADGGVEVTQMVLIPYYAWNNRGVGTMTVWFPTDRSLAQYDPNALPEESPFVEVAASHTYEQDTISAVADNNEPRWSNGNNVSRWSSRPRKDQAQWIEGRFSESRNIRSVGLYWFDNGKDVRVPANWSLEVQQDGEWKPFELYVTDEYGVRVNQYNVVHPAKPLQCDAIRVLMLPKKDSCVGVLEIDVVFESERVASQL